MSLHGGAVVGRYRAGEGRQVGRDTGAPEELQALPALPVGGHRPEPPLLRGVLAPSAQHEREPGTHAAHRESLGDPADPAAVEAHLPPAPHRQRQAAAVPGHAGAADGLCPPRLPLERERRPGEERLGPQQGQAVPVGHPRHLPRPAEPAGDVSPAGKRGPQCAPLQGPVPLLGRRPPGPQLTCHPGELSEGRALDPEAGSVPKGGAATAERLGPVRQLPPAHQGRARQPAAAAQKEGSGLPALPESPGRAEPPHAASRSGANPEEKRGYRIPCAGLPDCPAALNGLDPVEERPLLRHNRGPEAEALLLQVQVPGSLQLCQPHRPCLGLQRSEPLIVPREGRTKGRPPGVLPAVAVSNVWSRWHPAKKTGAILVVPWRWQSPSRPRTTPPWPGSAGEP